MKKLTHILFLCVIWLATLSAQDAIVENSTLSVESIEIVGTVRMQPQDILNRLSFGQSDCINEEILMQNSHLLQNSNCFKKVAITTRPGSAPDQLVVQINVEERPAPSLYFRGGFIELDGWNMTLVGLHLDNLIIPDCHTGLKVTVGDMKDGIIFYHGNDKFLNPDFQFYFEMSAMMLQCPHYTASTLYYQNVLARGGRLEISPARLAPNLTFGIGVHKFYPDKFMTKSLKLEEVEYALPAEIARNKDMATAGRLSVSTTRDTRDNACFPTRGFWGRASLDYVADLQGSAYHYMQGVVDARYYRAVRNRCVGAVRVKFGSTGPSTPFYDRFYLGGAQAVRGYDNYSLTPLGWATQLALLNLEYRIPLSRRNYPYHTWTMALFLDSGAIRQSGENDAVHFYHAVGFGLRVKAPIVGILRLDVGYPFEIKSPAIELSLGHAF